MFRALILDWSGTLVDDMGPTLAATNAVLERFDKPALTREEFRESFRLPYSEWYEEHLPGVPLEELEAHFREAFDASTHPVTPLEGTAEFLRWCERHRIRLFVLTSMDAPTFGSQVREFGFEGHFEATYAGVVDKRPVIREILETHRLSPGETAYVGDMAHDIETAHHGGVTPVGVLSGYDHLPRLASAGPRLLLSCIKSLHAMLEQWQLTGEPQGAQPRTEQIEIRRLQADAVIGVPAEERAAPQTLFISLTIAPTSRFREMNDTIARTVDYDAVARRVREVAAEKPRHLIETLAADLAEMVLTEFPAAGEVRVVVEKHVLPQTEAVTVRTLLRREDAN